MRRTPNEHGHAIDAARGGDLRAWEHVTRQHQEVVFRSAYLATRDTTSAEETSKLAFMRGYRSLHSLERGAAVRPWLMGIAATAARAHIRELTQRRDARVSDADRCLRLPAAPVNLDTGVPRPTPAEHEAIINAFDGLVDQDRLVIASRYAFHLSRADGAARLAITPDDIDDRLDAAMARLRARIAEMMAASVSSGLDGRMGGTPYPRIDRFAHFRDDQLGSMAMAVVMSELPWTPDVAPVVCAQLARDAIAYPEQFGARPATVMAGTDQDIAARKAPIPAPTSTKGGQGSTTGGSGVLPIAVVALAAVVALGGVSLTPGGPGQDSSGRERMAGSGGSGQVGSLPRQDADIGANAAEPPITADYPLVASQMAAVVSAEPATMSAPRLTIVGARNLGSGALGARVAIEWVLADGSDAVLETRLERRVAAGDWRSVASADVAGPLMAAIRPGKRYRFRVRSVDEAGTAVLSPDVRVELAVRGPRSQRLAVAPREWTTRRGRDTKRRLIATTPDASFSTDFRGGSVALVGPTGPSRSAIDVRVDDGPWAQDDLSARVPSRRTVLYSQELEQGRHSLDVRAETDGVAVDAVLILRTPRA